MQELPLQYWRPRHGSKGRRRVDRRDGEWRGQRQLSGGSPGRRQGGGVGVKGQAAHTRGRRGGRALQRTGRRGGRQEGSERRRGSRAAVRQQEDGELRQMRISPPRAGGSQADRGGRRVPLLGKEQWKRLAFFIFFCEKRLALGVCRLLSGLIERWVGAGS